MTDTSRNFTCISSKELYSELEKAERLNLELKRLRNQLKLHSYIPGLIFWTKDREELRGKEAVRYLKKRLVAVIRELAA